MHNRMSLSIIKWQFPAVSQWLSEKLMLLQADVQDGGWQMPVAQQHLHVINSFYCVLNTSVAKIDLCPNSFR